MEKKAFLDFIHEFTHYTDHGLVFIELSRNGIIQNAVCNQYNDVSLIVRATLTTGSSVDRYFVLPLFNELPILLKENSTRLFENKPGLLNFAGEPEEIYSSLPVLYLKLFNPAADTFIGVVHIAKYLKTFFSSPGREPLFCTDDEERLAAYNHYFADLFAASVSPGAMIGTALSDLLAPTPKAFQQTELKRFESLAPANTMPVWVHDFSKPRTLADGLRLNRGCTLQDGALEWSSEDALAGLLIFDALFHWPFDMLRLEIEIESASPGGLPCLMLADPPQTDDIAADRDGYLLGPGNKGTSLLVKRGGNRILEKPCDPALLEKGTFTYQTDENHLLVYKGSTLLFGYSDSDFISRGPSHIMLYLRAGNRCRISRISLHINRHVKTLQRMNFFVSSKTHSEAYYLCTHIHRFDMTHLEQAYTIYQLRNLSDLKQNLNGLEEAVAAQTRVSEQAQRHLAAFTQTESAFIGDSQIIAQIREKAERIAASDATVLIEGPTGTGKEVLARFIHIMSPRRNAPFVKVDCSTLPPTLLESLLFGHEKGAFTGATADRIGLFEQAAAGTLFIDEAANLTPDVQAKLLQFLQDQTLRPLGGNRSLRVDVRILVASNIPLKTLAEQGRFREDLYYRIAVLDIHLPPLRNHLDDVPALVNFFLKDLNRKYGKKVKGLSPQAYQQVYRHPWPGNIRELKNSIERAYLFAQGNEIQELVMTENPVTEALPALTRKRKSMRFLDEGIEEITRMVRKNRGNMRATALELGVTLRALYYYLKKHHVEPDDLRKNPRKQRSGD